MWRKLNCLGLAALLFGLGSSEAQQSKIPRIGYLISAPLSASTNRTEPFRKGLRELGYVEGKNIFIEWRSAEGNRERQRALAAELVRLNLDVIVTGGSGPTHVLKEATSTIPIVMTQSDDPVGSGLALSLARPGGNITGLSQVSPELSGKRLEILKEIAPKLSRVAVMGTSTSSSNAQVLREIELVARSFGITPQFLDVLTAKDLEPAFRAAIKGRADAILVLVSGNIRSPRRKEIAELAIKSQLPAMHERAEHAEAGGLLSYGVYLPDLDYRAATYVDRILKGAKPADLPVEQPTKFELVINLKTAKLIGLAIPPHVLARADRVIK
jgi:putative ABC transport system substrate-binding protein